MSNKDHKWLDRQNMPKQRAKIRRCKACKTKLSSYNLNDYCHAHRAQGIKDNFKKMQDEAYRKHQVQERYHKKKKEQDAKNRLV